MTRTSASRTPDGTANWTADAAWLLVCAVLVGSGFNALRPEESRLPWVGDWDRHIETLAFRAGIPVVFLAGLQNRLEDSGTRLLDARSFAEYAAGHLPGALSLPLQELDRRIATYAHLLALDAPIVVYCGGMECDDALTLALRLRDYGFENLTLYPGGFAEWVEYGGAIGKRGAP